MGRYGEPTGKVSCTARATFHKVDFEVDKGCGYCCRCYPTQSASEAYFPVEKTPASFLRRLKSSPTQHELPRKDPALECPDHLQAGAAQTRRKMVVYTTAVEVAARSSARSAEELRHRSTVFQEDFEAALCSFDLEHLLLGEVRMATTRPNSARFV